ncbi:MAG: sensor histidine kinase, partial [Frankiaceae bacterium]
AIAVDVADRAAMSIENARMFRDKERAEARLREVNTELSRSNADLEQFAYIASHDLQEPLRMVTSYTKLLAEDLGDRLDDTARRHLDFAHGGAVRMQQLVRDLLRYSRVSRGADTSRQWVDCDQLVETAKADLHEAIVAAEATATHDQLPNVAGIATELQQLFTNLIGNAVKFRGDEPVRVHVAAARAGPMWRFAVTDNGIGIDPAQAERIFEVFKRLHQRGRYPGTGIGLAICKKVVEHHGGRIWVDSQAGSGATFWFTLPAADNALRDR